MSGVDMAMWIGQHLNKSPEEKFILRYEVVNNSVATSCKKKFKILELVWSWSDKSRMITITNVIRTTHRDIHELVVVIYFRRSDINDRLP